MKPLLLFLVRLLGVSLLLFAIQRWIMMGYEALLLLTLYPFAESGAGASAYYDSSYRIIPLLALLLATPALPRARRLYALAAGVGVFWAMDFVSTLLFSAPPPKAMGPTSASQAHLIYSLMWELMGHWILPFLIWIMLAHRHLGEIFRPVGERLGRSA